MREFLRLFAVFANSEPVPGFNDGTLQLAFTDLRQVCVIKLFSFHVPNSSTVTEVKVISIIHCRPIHFYSVCRCWTCSLVGIGQRSLLTMVNQAANICESTRVMLSSF